MSCEVPWTQNFNGSSGRLSGSLSRRTWRKVSRRSWSWSGATSMMMKEELIVDNLSIKLSVAWDWTITSVGFKVSTASLRLCFIFFSFSGFLSHVIDPRARDGRFSLVSGKSSWVVELSDFVRWFSSISFGMADLLLPLLRPDEYAPIEFRAWREHCEALSKYGWRLDFNLEPDVEPF